jgi:hypothetical protein
LGDCFIWALLLNIKEVAQTLGLVFPTRQVIFVYLVFYCIDFFQNKFNNIWAILSKTHLVTLMPTLSGLCLLLLLPARHTCLSDRDPFRPKT